MNLPLAFLKMCRKVGGRSKMADLTGELTGRGLLIKTLVLRRALRPQRLELLHHLGENLLADGFVEKHTACG